MFILRKVFNENKEEYNVDLGDSYKLIMNQESEYYKFLFKEWGQSEEVYAFVVHGIGSKVETLYKKQQNYIMTSDGKTFANLTHR